MQACKFLVCLRYIWYMMLLLRGVTWAVLGLCLCKINIEDARVENISNSIGISLIVYFITVSLPRIQDKLSLRKVLKNRYIRNKQTILEIFQHTGARFDDSELKKYANGEVPKGLFEEKVDDNHTRSDAIKNGLNSNKELFDNLREEKILFLDAVMTCATSIPTSANTIDMICNYKNDILRYKKKLELSQDSQYLVDTIIDQLENKCHVTSKPCDFKYNVIDCIA